MALHDKLRIIRIGERTKWAGKMGERNVRADKSACSHVSVASFWVSLQLLPPDDISLVCCASQLCLRWTRFWLRSGGRRWWGSGYRSDPESRCWAERSWSESSAQTGTVLVSKRRPRPPGRGGGSILEQNGCPVIYRWVRVHLIVLVIDAKALPQVPEHHGTVLFELKATRQVFSGNKDTRESGVKQERMRKRRICSVQNLQGLRRKA